MPRAFEPKGAVGYSGVVMSFVLGPKSSTEVRCTCESHGKRGRVAAIP